MLRFHHDTALLCCQLAVAAALTGQPELQNAHVSAQQLVNFLLALDMASQENFSISCTQMLHHRVSQNSTARIIPAESYADESRTSILQ